MQKLIHRKNQTAHISLLCSKFSNNVPKTQTEPQRIYFLALTADQHLWIFTAEPVIYWSNPTNKRQNDASEGASNHYYRISQPLF